MTAAASVRPETLAYLCTLYDTAERGHLPLWTPTGVNTSETTWVRVADLEAVASEAARLGDAGRNVYHGIGLHEKPLGSDRRGTAAEVIAIPGAFIDVDVRGPAHKETALPPTRQAAIDLLGAFPLQPTMVVDSGHGLYGWWLFHEVFYVDGDRERAEAASVVRRLQRVIRAAARERGWKIENTADLSRVLRPVGLPNRKPNLEPVVVRVLSGGGSRYALDDFLPYLPDDEPEPRATGSNGAATDEPTADLGRILAQCPFMAHCRDDAAVLPEPEWYAMLTVASRCRDGERWAHDLSAPYPGYSHRETQAKYEHARAENKPLRCRTVEVDYGGDPYCPGCAHRGKIASPIVLGVPRQTLTVGSIGPNGRHGDAGENGGDGSATANAAGQAVAAEPCNLTDLGNARRLVAGHGADLRYCKPWGKWLAWGGTRWASDDTDEVVRRAKRMVRSLYAEAEATTDADERKAIARHALRSEGEARIRAAVGLAESEPGIPLLPDQLDAHPWVLNVRNGTLDLRTGELRAHDRGDYLTKLAPVAFDPAAACPTWLAFLDRIMAGNADLVEFLRRAAGYSLTGDTSERVILILYGEGRNGKTTLLETARGVLGTDYAVRTPTDTLLAKRDTAIPNDVARLRGARFVSASEADEGRRLDEAKVKDLTGGDTLTARFMRGEWFDFLPQFTLWLGTNHRPVIRGTDRAIWDRIALVPFSVRIPDDEQDKQLRGKLLAEAPGILAWMVGGCLAWQRDGLRTPKEVRAATEDYRTEMDVLAGFLDDRCTLSAGLVAPAKNLYAAYVKWCDETGEKPLTQKAVGQRLSERGFEPDRLHGGVRAWRGLALRDENAATQAALEGADGDAS